MSIKNFENFLVKKESSKEPKQNYIRKPDYGILMINFGPTFAKLISSSFKIVPCRYLTAQS